MNEMKATDVPMPMFIVIPNVHRTSNKDSVVLPFGPSAGSIPPLAPLACCGTSNIRLAAPSPPG